MEPRGDSNRRFADTLPPGAFLCAYAANYEMLKYVLNEIGTVSPDDFNVLFDQISPAILKDFKTENEFWTSNDSKMNDYMDFTFDKLLKLNNQPKGIYSYQNIVIWLWNIHKKELKKSESQMSESPKD